MVDPHADPPVRFRSSKRQAFRVFYTGGNEHSEWSVQVEPDGLRIDCFHKGEPPHLDWPPYLEEAIPLPGLSFERAVRALQVHTAVRLRIELDVLLRELKGE